MRTRGSECDQTSAVILNDPGNFLLLELLPAVHPGSLKYNFLWLPGCKFGEFADICPVRLRLVFGRAKQVHNRSSADYARDRREEAKDGPFQETSAINPSFSLFSYSYFLHTCLLHLTTRWYGLFKGKLFYSCKKARMEVMRVLVQTGPGVGDGGIAALEKSVGALLKRKCFSSHPVGQPVVLVEAN
jgi:hypothetical protein